MEDTKNIQTGFNQGYLLQKHKPELAKAISEGFVNKSHPYSEGFIAGMKEVSKVKSKIKSKYDLPKRNFIPKATRIRDKGDRVKDLGDREK